MTVLDLLNIIDKNTYVYLDYDTHAATNNFIHGNPSFIFNRCNGRCMRSEIKYIISLEQNYESVIHIVLKEEKINVK